MRKRSRSNMLSSSSLLRQLVQLQILLTVVSIAVIGVVGYAVAQLKTYRSLLDAREDLRAALAEREDRWRALGYLDLNEALNEEIAQFEAEHPHISISVRHATAADETADGVVLPEKFAPGELIISAHMDGYAGQKSLSRTNQTWLTLLGIVFFFTCSISVAAYFIRRKIFTPLYQIREWLPAVKKGELVSTENIKAEGEIKEVIDLIFDLFQQAKATEKQIAISAIAAQVAHDVRSPLTAISVILSDGDNYLNYEKRRLLQEVSERIIEITNNLRARLSHVNQGGEDVGVIDRIESPLILVRSIVAEKIALYSDDPKVRIELNSEEEAVRGASVFVDPGEYKRLLSNIIDNAREAAKESGIKIVVSVGCVNNQFRVTIKDNGKGISKEHLARVTERGFSFGKVGGTGLGLYQANSALDKCNGQLSIQSELEKGTLVTVVVPLAGIL